MSINHGVYFIQQSLDKTLINKDENSSTSTSLPPSSPSSQSKKITTDASMAISRALANFQNISSPPVPTQYMQDITKKSVCDLAKKICSIPPLNNGYPSESAINNDLFSGNR